jgi:hypothetical protein
MGRHTGARPAEFFVLISRAIRREAAQPVVARTLQKSSPDTNPGDTMNRHLPVSGLVAFVSIFAVGSGCASAPPSMAANPTCVSSDGFLCANDLAAFPFAMAALTVSDYCVSQPPLPSEVMPAPCVGVTPPAGATTLNMSHPDAGKLCVSGRVKPGGFAMLALEFGLSNSDHTKILEPFDAAGRGITQIALEFDSPPSQGVALQAHMITHRECAASSLDCFYPPNFKFKDITAPGPVIAALADFRSEDDPSERIDASVLHDVFFQVGPGDYAFCVHDFNLLDAAGNTVKP